MTKNELTIPQQYAKFWLDYPYPTKEEESSEIDEELVDEGYPTIYEDKEIAQSWQHHWQHLYDTNTLPKGVTEEDAIEWLTNASYDTDDLNMIYKL